MSPTTTCRRAIALTLVAVCLTPLGAHATPTPNCYPLSDTVCDVSPVKVQVPLDMNVIAAQSLFSPPSADVRLGGTVYFQNLDGQLHTVSSVGCVTLGTGPCLFDRTLPVGSAAIRALALPISPHDFEQGKTYAYKCRIHLGMKGSFTVR